MKQHTTAIKAKFSNAVHKLLEPNLEIKARDRWRFKGKYELTDAQKLEIFDQIEALHKECSSELQNYLYKRRSKRRIEREREARKLKKAS